LGQTKIWVKKKICVKKNFGKKICSSNFWVKKILRYKNFCVKKMLVKKNLRKKKICVKRIWGQKKFA